MCDSPQRPETRIVVELVSSEAVRRLEARDDDLRREMQQLEKRLEGLHGTLYELLEAFGELKRRR